MRNLFSRTAVVFAVLCAGTLLALAGCGGGGGGGEAPDPGGGWVTITSPTSEPTFTDYCNEAYLAGEAFISPDWSAVGGGTVITGVTVTWFNAATGGRGQATQSASVCYVLGSPVPCNHVWWATVPMAVGINEITITATDPDGRTGTDTITIDHPQASFSLSGTVSTGSGAPLSFRESQIDLTLSDGSTTRRTVTSLDGSYRFSCARSDLSYTITPSSPIAYGFTPPERLVQVVNADVSSLDFTAPAWFLSGRVLRDNGTGVAGIMVEVEEVNGAGTAVSQLTDDSGAYRLALPDGTYTLHAYDFWGYYSVSPDGWTGEVAISGADLTDRDFLATHQ